MPGLEPSFAPVGEATLAGLHILQPVQTQEIIKSLFHVLFSLKTDHDSHFSYHETYQNQDVFYLTTHQGNMYCRSIVAQLKLAFIMQSVYGGERERVQSYCTCKRNCCTLPLQVSSSNSGEHQGGDGRTRLDEVEQQERFWGSWGDVETLDWDG